MSTEVYHFKVGAFECMAVSDGTLTYTPPTFPPPATLLFCNAPRGDLEHTLRQHNIQPEHWAEWISQYICLLVNTGEHRVLVDTGADGLDPNTGKLLQNLQAEGIAPEDIDMVILTHCHPDHIGGNTLDNGKPAFPNARFAMWKDEWDFWTSKQAEEKLDEHVREVLLSVARKNLPPIQERLDLIEREREILPGIHAIAAPGHTPGHMALVISSEGEQLLCISDTALHPIHLEQPEWCAAVDFAPDQVVATRRRILKRAAAEKALVLAFHFPFPGLGHIVQKGEAWQWQPIATMV
ncbi:MAG: MBL fold metallo-hydrolase [Desulfobacterales bacterium]|nr:MBL fold metallo-hydrolase [Desulfobacterales bacterium]